MRANQGASTRRNAVGIQKQAPAPVGGLNARDALTEMAPTDALTLTNFFPEATTCRLRRGYIEWATGMPATVETVMEWAGDSREMYAASDDSIFNVTASGAVGAAVVTGLTNARFQHVMFSNAAGSFLVAVNGADGVQTYDGSTWAVQAVTGVDPLTFFQVASFKRRLWFAQKHTSKVWYLGADAISGAANPLDFGSVWKSGGTLRRIIAASYDVAAGTQDYIGFLSSNGEVAIYQGTDPASSSTFALVGVYLIGAPVGDRCSYQSGGDTVIITTDGALSLLQMMQVGDRTVSPRASITDKISPLITEAWATYGSLYGWQIVGFPTRHMAVLNVPTSASTSDQYVLNAITGAWCKFTNHNAICWGNFNDGLYFGAAGGKVFKFDTGTDDNGAQIPFAMRTSFQGYGDPGLLKRFTMLRPVLIGDGIPPMRLGLDVDYGVSLLDQVLGVTQSLARWDIALWDVDLWGGDALAVLQWATVGNIGRVAAVRLEGQVTGFSFNVNAFTLMFEPSGGPAL